MPDTFDLETAFRDLAHDIADVTHAPGADAAVRDARRRRRTTIGAVAAAVLLAGAGVTIGQSVSHRDEPLPPTGQVPAPAPLDGPHLTQATTGWTPAWTARSRAAQEWAQQEFGGDCLVGIPGGSGAITLLGNSHGDAAVAFMSDYGIHADQARRDWQRLERQISRCGRVVQISSFHGESGLAGHTYRITPTVHESAPEYVWIVSTGTEIGELKIVGQREALPASNDRPVADALLAAAQDPATYLFDPFVSTGPAVPVIGEGEFARALGDWRSGWQATGDSDHVFRQVRCFGSWTGPAGASAQEDLGANGYQEYATFSSRLRAREALRSVARSLRSCDSARYAVSGPMASSRSTLMVANGPYVLWLAQRDSTVGVIRVPSAGFGPPRQVTTRVGALMFAAMDTAAASQ